MLGLDEDDADDTVDPSPPPPPPPSRNVIDVVDDVLVEDEELLALSFARGAQIKTLSIIFKL